jgi:hypothetical protein
MIQAPPQPAADPMVARYLGSAAGAGGPFALLGLPHTIDHPDRITEAAARRLNQLNRHTLRLTPEADEIRLAIHAAAAQLADPALRAELAKHWPEGSQEATPAAWRIARSRISDQLAAQARRIVGASGGWNSRAKRRLAVMARTNRVNPTELVRAVRPRVSRARPAAARIALPHIPEPTSAGRFWLGTHLTLLTMLSVMSVLVVVELRRPPPPAPPETKSNATANASPSPAIPGPRDAIEHPAALEQELRNTVLIAIDRPVDAASRTPRIVDAYAARWSEADPAARLRITDLFKEVALRLSTVPEAFQPLADAIDTNAVSPNPSVSAAALSIAAEILSQPELPLTARSTLPTVAPELLQARSPDARLLAALERRTPASNDDLDWWTAWSDAVESCEAAPAARRTEARLNAVVDVLSAKGTPAQATRPILTLLTSPLGWRAREPARRWLLDVLENDSLNPERVSLLTSVVATELSTPGIDASMVLSERPSRSQRVELAARYRAAWMAGRVAPGAVTDQVMQALDEALLLALPKDDLETATVIRVAATANAAASLLFSGDEPAAADVLAPPPEIPSGDTPAPPASLTDDWARAVLSTDDPDQLTGLLAQAAGQYGCTTLAAEALVEVALRGPSRETRDHARVLIVTRARSAEVLLALEHALTTRSSAVLAEIIAQALGMPPPNTRDPAWPAKARVSLLTTIAELALTPASDPILIVELTLSELAARRAGLPTNAVYAASVERESESWSGRDDLPQNHRLSTNAVNARLTADLGLALGPAQSTAAYSKALFERMLGASLSREAVDSSVANKLLARLDASWAAAPNAAHQILAAERAQAELWKLLLETAP